MHQMSNQIAGIPGGSIAEMVFSVPHNYPYVAVAGCSSYLRLRVGFAGRLLLIVQRKVDGLSEC
jgi:hypothetical protein